MEATALLQRTLGASGPAHTARPRAAPDEERADRRSAPIRPALPPPVETPGS